MSINRREEVLDRLFAIMSNPDLGFVTHYRNRAMLENDKHPSVILLDGDEERTSASRPGRAGVFAAAIVKMRPQIFILLKNQKPKLPELLGPSLNEFRGKLLRAIAADAQLSALIGPNGSIEYDGAETDLKTGAALEGQMQISLSITVPLNPNA